MKRIGGRNHAETEMEFKYHLHIRKAAGEPAAHLPLRHDHRGRPHGLALHVRIQTAAAYEHLGKREEARAWLGKALSGAAPDGLVMPFVENYAHLKPLLVQELKTDLIAKITELGEGAGARNAASARPAVFDALTPREFEIVELMAQRLSNREIAEKLYLSEGSVKQYVNQIYSKLHMEGDTRTKRKRLAELFGQKT